MRSNRSLLLLSQARLEGQKDSLRSSEPPGVAGALNFPAAAAAPKFPGRRASEGWRLTRARPACLPSFLPSSTAAFSFHDFSSGHAGTPGAREVPSDKARPCCWRAAPTEGSPDEAGRQVGGGGGGGGLATAAPLSRSPPK